MQNAKRRALDDTRTSRSDTPVLNLLWRSLLAVRVCWLLVPDKRCRENTSTDQPQSPTHARVKTASRPGNKRVAGDHMIMMWQMASGDPEPHSDAVPLRIAPAPSTLHLTRDGVLRVLAGVLSHWELRHAGAKLPASVFQA